MSQKQWKYLLQEAIVNGPGVETAHVFDGRFTVKCWGVEPDGADLITNGGFAADTDWPTQGTGWSISGGNASSDASQVGDSDLTQTIAALVPGEAYEVSITVSGRTAGNVTPVVGDTEGTDRATNSTFVETIVCGAGGDFDLRADLNFDGDVDDVTCKLVNAGFDGATVECQILAEDNITWIPFFTFTADGVQFGEVGSQDEEFRAEVSNVGVSTKVNCTITH